MKKIITFLAFFSILTLNTQAQTVWNGTDSDISWYSDSESTFNISTASQLAGLAELSATKTFSGKTINLTANILLNETSGWESWDVAESGVNAWTPIGTSTAFAGTFNGNGYTISGMYIDNAALLSAGLFGSVTENAVIKNVNVTAFFIKGNNNVGGLAGSALNSSITNCHTIAGKVTGAANVGGLVGRYESATTTINVNNSSNGAEVTGTNDTGGFVGYAAGEIKYCYNTGNVNGATNAGGFVGYNATNISNCYSLGAVDGTSVVGGFAGYNDSTDGEINNSYCAGAVTGGNAFVGSATTVSNCYYGNDVCGGATESCGGTTGKASADMKSTAFVNELNANDSNSSWFVSGNYPTLLSILSLTGDGTEGDPYLIYNETDLNYMAYIINTQPDDYADKYYKIMADISLNNTTGWSSWGDSEASLAQWTPAKNFSGTLDGNNHTISGMYLVSTATDGAGLFSITGGATIRDLGIIESYIKGTYRVGAFVGAASAGTFENCYSSARVTGASETGGLFGMLIATPSQCTVTGCYNTGIVTGVKNTGGVAGALSGYSVINNSYNTGSVSTTDINTGGIVGFVETATIKNVYNTGTISGNASTGGIAGASGSFIANSYATGQVIGSSAASCGGFVGSNSGSITNSYAASQTTDANAFVGNNTGYIGSSYYDNQLGAPQPVASSLQGKTTEEMKGNTLLFMLNEEVITGSGEGYNYWGILTANTYPVFHAAGTTLHIVRFNKNNTDSENNGQIEPSPTAMVVKDGETVSGLPVAPQRNHYRFLEWNNITGDETAFDASTIVSTDTTVYAKWKIKKYNYTIYYHYQGTIDDTQTIRDSADYNTVVYYTAKPRTGYKLSAVPAGITITGDAAQNIMNVYYVKDKFDYTIEYYYDEVLDSDSTIAGNGTFDSIVTYLPKPRAGYVVDSTNMVNDQMPITADPANNVLKVYYNIGTFDYKIEYFYAGTVANDSTILGSAVYLTEIEYPEKPRRGYILDSTDPENGKLIVSDTLSKNILQVYYIKGMYDYEIFYYYDDELVPDSTIANVKAQFEATINYTPKPRTGYVLDSVRPESGSIVISDTIARNVIDVYYSKGRFPYSIEYYYDNVIDNGSTVSNMGLYDSLITYTDKPRTGYKFVSVSPAASLNISEIAANNVIRVYYEKDQFPYTIEYYYDDEKDETKTIKGKVLFGSSVTYTDKSEEGYALLRVEPSATITITADSASNVIKVFYSKQSFNCRFEYYYKPYTSSTPDTIIWRKNAYGTKTSYVRLPGFSVEYTVPAVDSITVSSDSTQNVMKVYGEVGVYQYRHEHYFDNVLDDIYTTRNTAPYGQRISKGNPVSKEGYVFTNTYYPESGFITVSDDIESNVIKYFYESIKFQYTVYYYYDGDLDPTATVIGTANDGAVVGFTHKDKPGFIFEKTNPASGTITISTNAAENVIDVYYWPESKMARYTFIYIYEGAIIEDSTVVAYGRIGTEVSYLPKPVEGYNYIYLDPAATITLVANPEGSPDINVIRIFYSEEDPNVGVNKVTGTTLFVYPNPAMDYFRVDGITATEKLIISDLTGKRLMETTISPDDYVNIANLPRGIYIVTIGNINTKLVKH